MELDSRKVRIRNLVSWKMFTSLGKWRGTQHAKGVEFTFLESK